MSILNLIDQVRRKCVDRPHPLFREDFQLRRSYLTGVAIQIHADGVVDEQEQNLFLLLAATFKVPEEEARAILEKAARTDEETVLRIRDHLIDSKHKYYFILDLQIMAHQDTTVKPVEREVIERFGKLLEIAPEDMRYFTRLADAVVSDDPVAKDNWLKSFCGNLRIAEVAKPEDFSFYTDESETK